MIGRVVSGLAAVAGAAGWRGRDVLVAAGGGEVGRFACADDLVSKYVDT